MKKLFFSAMFAVMALGASAQQQPAKTFSVSPNIGLGYGGFRTYIVGYEPSGGFQSQIGGEAVYKFNNWFGLGLGLDFGFFFSNEGKDDLDIYGSYNFYTMDIPLIAHFDVSRHFGLYAGIGANFMLRATQIYDDHNGNRSTYKITDVKTASLFFPVGIKFTFNKPWFVGVQANIPATRWNEVETEDNVFLDIIMVTVGYRFDFKKK